jgi:hypothetical protein
MMVAVNVFFTLHLYSQEGEHNFSVQINPLKLFSQIFEDELQIELDLQFRINDYWNIMLRPNVSIDDFKQNDISLNLMPGMMFRPFGTGLKGIYIGLYPNIGWQNATIENTNNNYLIIGIRAAAGHQWIFDNGFTFTLGGGVIKNRRIGLNGAYSYAKEENIWQSIRLTLLLGYSF